MMKRLTMSVLCGVSLLTLAVGICASPRGTDGYKVLESGDEKAMIKYLETHHIPNMPRPGMTGGPSPNHPGIVSELDRALALFKGGSPELRLAIAKSLWPYSQQRIMEFWKACGAEDWEAKHYLAGLALGYAGENERKAIRKWLLKKADPSYATALLRYLDEHSLHNGLNAAEADAFLPFLESLYRQEGTVVPGLGSDSDFPAASCQAYTVRLLPATVGGRDLLLKWLISDSKKVDPKALRNLWVKWRRTVGGQGLPDQDFLSEAVKRRALAESWLLSSYRPDFCADQDVRSAFLSLARDQVLNPDGRVRRSAIARVLWGQIPSDNLASLKRLPGVLCCVSRRLRIRKESI
jgi:hypothetical protein